MHTCDSSVALSLTLGSFRAFLIQFNQKSSSFVPGKLRWKEIATIFLALELKIA